MMDDWVKINRVVDILNSPETSLKALANLSGRSVFSFYQGADLTDLDLSRQDLRGLNFKNSDLRFSNLYLTTFDDGALNNSILDNSQNHLKDQYLFDIDDLLAQNPDEILLFSKFREGLIDEFILECNINYREFSIQAEVSESALRKARFGKVTSLKTMQNIGRVIYGIIHSSERIISLETATQLKQPNVELLVGGNNAPFRPISIDALTRAKQVRNARILHHLDHNDGPAAFRDTVEYLSMFEHLLDDGINLLRENHGYQWFSTEAEHANWRE